MENKLYSIEEPTLIGCLVATMTLTEQQTISGWTNGLIDASCALIILKPIQNFTSRRQSRTELQENLKPMNICCFSCSRDNKQRASTPRFRLKPAPRTSHLQASRTRTLSPWTPREAVLVLLLRSSLL